MELSRKETKMLQALSVLAMVWLHLFDKWDYADKFVPLIFVGEVPLSFYFAQLSDFCVFSFAFCSGYGHFAQAEKPGYYVHRLKGLLSFYVNYWLILIVFSLISLAAGQGSFMPGNTAKFVLNAFGLEFSYNGAWWYILVYTILVLSSPLLMRSVKQLHPILVLGTGFVIYCIAYYVRFRVSGSGWLLIRFGPLGMTLFEYLIGAECCKLKTVSFLRGLWNRIRKPMQWMIAVTLLGVLLYLRTKVVPSLFVAPISGFAVMMLFIFWQKPICVEQFFMFIGKHSTNIWLTHMFFYSVLFKDFVYIAKYPLVIFAFMILITTAISIVLQRIEKYLSARTVWA